MEKIHINQSKFANFVAILLYYVQRTHHQIYVLQTYTKLAISECM
jgi:hypothetical protein